MQDSPRQVSGPDPLLTNMSIGYINENYIADRWVPILTTDTQAGLIPKYDQSHWFRNAARMRAPGTETRRGGFKVDFTDSYFCPGYDFGFEIPDELRRAQVDPFNYDRDGTLFCTDRVQMAREIACANRLFTTGVWTADQVGGVDFTQWDDYGASEPLFDFTTYNDSMELRIAREANTVVMGKRVWSSLKWHPQLIDTIKYTQRGQMTPEIFAGLVEIPNVYIGRGIYTTSPEGTAEASVVYQRIWGNHALFIYQPPVPSMMTPAAAYTMVWTIVPNALQYITRLRENSRHQDVIEAFSWFIHKLTAQGAGQFLSNAVSA